jgi:hypothetical protein
MYLAWRGIALSSTQVDDPHAFRAGQSFCIDRNGTQSYPGIIEFIAADSLLLFMSSMHGSNPRISSAFRPRQGNDGALGMPVLTFDYCSDANSASKNKSHPGS